MISIQITCPFRYKYNGKQQKDIFFMAGEYYHLDVNTDKDEIKKILSPSFEFKQYVHINLETVPKELLKGSRLEAPSNFHSNPNPEEIEYVSTLVEGTRSSQQIEDPGPDYEEPTTKDAEENFFAKQIDAAKLPRKDKKEQEAPLPTEEKLEEEAQGALNTPDLAPLEEEHKEVAEATPAFVDGEKEARRKELDELHYTKIQDVAEQYHIEYTKKDPTIEAILEAEFSIHEDIKELEGQYKTDEDLKG